MGVSKESTFGRSLRQEIEMFHLFSRFQQAIGSEVEPPWLARTWFSVGHESNERYRRAAILREPRSIDERPSFQCCATDRVHPNHGSPRNPLTQSESRYRR